jgi:hypothetical protein
MLTTLKWRGEVAVTQTGENKAVPMRTGLGLLLREARGGDGSERFRHAVSWVFIIHFLGGLA